VFPQKVAELKRCEGWERYWSSLLRTATLARGKCRVTRRKRRRIVAGAIGAAPARAVWRRGLGLEEDKDSGTALLYARGEKEAAGSGPS